MPVPKPKTACSRGWFGAALVLICACKSTAGEESAVFAKRELPTAAAQQEDAPKATIGGEQAGGAPSAPAVVAERDRSAHATPDRKRRVGADDAPMPYVSLSTGGADASEALPWIVALHGLGDRPESFSRSFAAAPFRAHVYVPRALLPWGTGGEGFDWYGVRVSGDARELSQAMLRAAQRVVELIRFLERDERNRGKPIVTGFSQGGMLSFALATRHPSEIRASLPIGGWLPPPLWPADKPSMAVPIIAFHGEQDRVVRFDPTRRAVEHLAAGSWDVRLEAYPGLGHSIHRELRDDWYHALGELVADTDSASLE